MDDLISRQAAITLPIMPKEYRKHKPNDCDDAYEQGWGDCQSCIGLLPTAEKKGRWVLYNEMWGLWECSECGAVIHSESKKDRKEYHAFCGRCGARMEE